MGHGNASPTRKSNWLQRDPATRVGLRLQKSFAEGDAGGADRQACANRIHFFRLVFGVPIASTFGAVGDSLVRNMSPEAEERRRMKVLRFKAYLKNQPDAESRRAGPWRRCQSQESRSRN